MAADNNKIKSKNKQRTCVGHSTNTRYNKKCQKAIGKKAYKGQGK